MSWRKTKLKLDLDSFQLSKDFKLAFKQATGRDIVSKSDTPIDKVVKIDGSQLHIYGTTPQLSSKQSKEVEYNYNNNDKDKDSQATGNIILDSNVNSQYINKDLDNNQNKNNPKKY